MVGLMAACPRERVAGLMDSVCFDTDIRSKLQHLRQLKDELSNADTVLLSEFLSGLLKLQNDPFSPVRKFVADIVGEIGSSHPEFLPEIVPTLMNIVEDNAPAVARQAISSGTDIFHRTLQKVATQGLHTSELDDSLESAWAWTLKLKEKFYSTAFQLESDGRRLLALKFVQAVILIYTPDPSGSIEPPPCDTDAGMFIEFNVSWLRKGHPVLKVGDLSIEASQSLGLLLDQLRYLTVKSLSTSMVIVLIYCLSTIATRRPSFYGRILPVLLGLDPSSSTMKGVHVYGVQNALKNAFLSCLKCTHPSAKPWQDRLIVALREMKSGGFVEHALEGVCNDNRNVMKDAPVIVKEPSTTISNSVPSNSGRKRSGVEEFGERSEDSDSLGKRIRSMPDVSKGSTEQPKSDIDANNIGVGPAAHSTEVDSEHVQQLVALFGALVAQGGKAVPSLEILISSISADLLAEVVIANLKYIPSTRPKAEGDVEMVDADDSNSKVFDRDAPFRKLSAFISNALSSSISTQLITQMEIQPSSDQSEFHQVKEEPHGVAETDVDMVRASVDERMENTVDKPGVPYDYACTEASREFSSFTSQIQDVVSVDGFIPGLDAAPSDRLPETMPSSSLASTNVDDTSQDQAVSSGRKSELDSVPSLSTERSEEISPKAMGTDEIGGVTSTATSLVSVQKFVLPKISAPVIDLTDEEKDQLQKLTFLHIVEAYKQVASAGGSQLHCYLLSILAVEFPLDLDPWTVLQQHILSDYGNNEGHELTLRVLYRLYGEAEEDCDFFSSRTASSVYETFLLKVAETLRDSFPASDKKLRILIGEIPYLPDSILRLLERLCFPDTIDGKEKELYSGDRVTQGLSCVWSLILQRPPIRNALLEITLKSAVHKLEEVRMKAIRLVANKLYPLSFISLRIEEFAKEMLLSVAKDREPADDEKLSTQSQKISDMGPHSNQQSSLDGESKDTTSATHQSSTSGIMSSNSTSEVGRCMSLYFALCTKKHSLLQQIFLVYKSSPLSVKQAVHSHVPILIRTIGASPTLLEIISDPPDGSDNLLMQVLHTLTDGTIPSPELISTIKRLFETRGKDIEVLLPILTFLTKDEVLSVFSSLVKLPLEKLQAALGRLLQDSPPSGSLLSPSEALIAIHGIDPERDGIPLKKVTDACNVCFEQRQIFTQQVVAKVLNQLVEQIPLPLLFMRTVLQAIGAFPALVDFIMEILSRLVSKQIWKYPKLWVGFLKCAQLTQPHSFSVLLQLPPAQLENALNKIPALRATLAAHADQPNVKSTLPRSVLTVLGINVDSQVSGQTQAASADAVDASGGDKETVTEKSKESSSAS